MTRNEIIDDAIGVVLLAVFAFGWMDTLWIFGVENSQQYTWWNLIQYFAN